MPTRKSIAPEDDPNRPLPEGTPDVRVEAETATAVGKANDNAPEEASEGRTPPFRERASENAWWCPVCDNASTHLITVCPKCGYKRKGAPA